jgi:snRNA-activating protein complex subunit 3
MLYPALTSPQKKSADGMEGSEDEAVCVITFSVHCRTGRSRNYFTKTSQHAILSSQTVGDMFEVIPCTSNEIPSETVDADSALTGFAPLDPSQPTFSGCVVCIEGVAYGDGQSDEDYSEYVTLF